MPSDPADLVDAILAVTPELLPTQHFDQCEAMTDVGRVVWRSCECRRRQAARQAAAARPEIYRQVATLADDWAASCTWPKGRPVTAFAAHLRELADQLDTQETP